MKKTAFRFQISAFRKFRAFFSRVFLKADSRQLKAGSRGFTLLLAALVASIVLALGTSIFQIAQKEFSLSAMGRDSQFAFYAADTGAECALYWDIRYKYFGTSTPPAAPAPFCDEQSLIASGNTDITGRPPPRGASEDDSVLFPYTMSFTIAPNDRCASVVIEKTLDPSSHAPRTLVRSSGFSTDCASVATSPRALQRSVELHY